MKSTKSQFSYVSQAVADETHGVLNNPKMAARACLKRALRQSSSPDPAAHIEGLVTGRICTWLTDPIAVLNALQCCGSDAVAQKRLSDEAARLAGSWQELDADRLRAILRATVTRVQVHSDRVDVAVDQMGVALWLNARINGNLLNPEQMTQSDI